MEWVALSITFLGLIYFGIHYRGFRRGLLYVTLGLVALGAVGGLVAWYNNYRTEERRRAASTLIDSRQIEIIDAKLALGVVPSLTGVVANKGLFPLRELSLKVTVSDCPPNLFSDLIPKPPPGYVLDPPNDASAGENPFAKYKRAQDAAKCGVVGQDVATIYSINVPEGQKRAFQAYISLPNLPQMKEWSWQYSIERVEARID